jgi:hypothetical protein
MPATPVKPAPKKALPEVVWIPVFSEHTYPAKTHNHHVFIIEPPNSFTGEEGTYKLVVEKSGKELVMKVPISDALSDPHNVHGLLTHEYLRIFANNLAKEQNWKTKCKPMQGKEAVWRHKLKFKCLTHFSSNMGHDGVLFCTIEKADSKSVSVLIVQQN